MRGHLCDSTAFLLLLLLYTVVRVTMLIRIDVTGGTVYIPPQQPGAPMVTAVPVQPHVGLPPVFPVDPVHTTCPNCHQVVTTVTEPIMGLLAWLIVGGLCVVGLVSIVRNTGE